MGYRKCCKCNRDYGYVNENRYEENYRTPMRRRGCRCLANDLTKLICDLQEQLDVLEEAWEEFQERDCVEDECDFYPPHNCNRYF